MFNACNFLCETKDELDSLKNLIEKDDKDKKEFHKKIAVQLTYNQQIIDHTARNLEEFHIEAEAPQEICCLIKLIADLLEGIKDFWCNDCTGITI